jgi:excisionase family DNA binding protein
MDKVCLCPKEVGHRLGVSTRTAQALMRAGEIESFRVGVKLLRTTAHKVEEFQARQFATHRTARVA